MVDRHFDWGCKALGFAARSACTKVQDKACNRDLRLLACSVTSQRYKATKALATAARSACYRTERGMIVSRLLTRLLTRHRCLVTRPMSAGSRLEMFIDTFNRA